MASGNAPPTHVGSGIRVGNVFNRAYPIAGAFASQSYTFSATPTVSTASAAANFATVSNANWTIAAGPGFSTVTIQGVTYVDLGVARVVTATGSTASVAAVAITISGREEIVALDGTRTSGAIMVQTFTGPSGIQTVTSPKTMRYVSVASTTGNTVGPVAIGVGDTIGFPYRALYPGQVLMNYDGTVITSSAGFTAAVTTTATATSGDVRGKYALQSAANGAKVFVATINLDDPNTTTGLYGVPQYSG